MLPEAAYHPLVEELNAVIDQKARQARDTGQLEDIFAEAPFERRLAQICAALGTASDSLAKCWASSTRVPASSIC